MQTHEPQPQGGGDWGTHNQQQPQEPWGQQPPGSWGALPASEHQQQQQQSNAGATSNQQQQGYWGVAPQQQQPPPQSGQVPAPQEMQPQPPLLGTMPGAEPVAPGPPTMFAGISFGPGQAPVPYIAPFPIQVGQQVMVEGREDQPPGVVAIIGPQIPPQGVPALRVLPPTVYGTGPAPGAAPAPSAMPQRQESWGMPPAQASWVAPGEHQVNPNLDPNRPSLVHRQFWFFQILGWILTLIVWFLLFFNIPVCETRKTFNGLCSPDWYGEGAVFVFLGILYVSLVAISCVCTPVREYLQNILPGGVEPYLEKLESATPAIRSEIVCYNETDKGHKNVLHKAQYDYPYDAWWDVSEPMANTGHSGATRVHLSAEWKAADTHTEQVHGKLHAAFVAANEQQVKDADADYHCVTIKAVLPDFHREVLYFSNPQDRPICIGFVWLVLFSVLTFGMPYQAYFYARTAATHFVCTKLIRRDRRPDDPQ